MCQEFNTIFKNITSTYAKSLLFMRKHDPKANPCEAMKQQPYKLLAFDSITPK